MEIRYDDGNVNGRRRVLVQWDSRGPFVTLDEAGEVGETLSPVGLDLLEPVCDCGLDAL